MAKARTLPEFSLGSLEMTESRKQLKLFAGHAHETVGNGTFILKGVGE